jgi:hypothetical protein
MSCQKGTAFYGKPGALHRVCKSLYYSRRLASLCRMMLGDDRVAAEGYPLVCVHTNLTFEKFISHLAFVS